MGKKNFKTILQKLQYSEEHQYDITFSFKILKTQSHKIESKIDRYTAELIPPITTLEDNYGILFNIVWIQDISDSNTFYLLDKQYINENDIICYVTIRGKLHKINSGYNNNSMNCRNFISLP